MKFAVLVYSGSGVVVYEGGTDPAKLGEILASVEQAVDFPVQVAILHSKKELPLPKD